VSPQCNSRRRQLAKVRKPRPAQLTYLTDLGRAVEQPPLHKTCLGPPQRGGTQGFDVFKTQACESSRKYAALVSRRLPLSLS
jgi:hypothetical protein